jgi:hypothetical protein
MQRDLHPTDGARYLLERDDGASAGSVEAGVMRYRVAIYTPDTAYTATAALGTDGSVELGATGAPAELHARLATIAKLVARDAARLGADGLPAWPQRILRWRR